MTSQDLSLVYLPNQFGRDSHDLRDIKSRDLSGSPLTFTGVFHHIYSLVGSMDWLKGKKIRKQTYFPWENPWFPVKIFP